MDNSNSFLLRETSQQLRSLSFDPNHAALAETSNLMISILPRRDENDPERFKALVSVHVYGHRRVEWSRLKVRLLSAETDSVTSLAAARYVSLNPTGQAVFGDLPLGRYRVAAKLDLPNVVVLEDDIKRAVGYADGGVGFSDDGAPSVRPDTVGLIATICGEAGDTVRIWDIAGERCLGEIQSFGVNLLSATRLHDTPHLLVRGEDASLWVTDLSGGHRFCLRFSATAHDGLVAINLDGSRIAISDAEGIATVCDRDGDEIYRWKGSATNLVTALAVDGAGERVALGARDGSIEMRSLASASCLKILGHTDAIGSLTFIDQDRRLVSSAADGKVIVWDSASGNCLHIVESDHLASPLVAATPSGSRLALATADGVVRMLDIECSSAPELRNRDGAPSSVSLEKISVNPLAIVYTEGGACLWQRLIDTDLLERLEFVSDDALAVVTASGVVFVLNTSDGKLQSTFMTVETDDPSINILVSTYGAEARIEAVSHRPAQAGSQIQVILTAPQGGEPWDERKLELIPDGDGFACRSHAWTVRFEPGDRFAVQALRIPAELSSQ